MYKKRYFFMEFTLDKNTRKDIRETRYSEKKIRSMNYKSW